MEEKSFFAKRLEKERKEVQILDHQISLGIDTITNHLKHLKNRLNEGKPISNEKLESVIDTILTQTEMLKSIASFVTQENFEKPDLNPWSQENEGDMVEFIKQYINRFHVVSDETTPDQEVVPLTVKCRAGIEFKRVFNPYKFRTVIDNLISNARKKEIKAKHIEVTIDVTEKKNLELRIKDDGIGISNEDLKTIFDFGFSKTGGSGIGLYHVKKIMDEYGSIEVNNNLEKGVEFILEVMK